MKIFNYLVVLSASIFLLTTLTNCKKDNEQYTVKGKLFATCDNPNPLANFEVYLYNDKKGVLVSGTCNAGELARTTTNDNGDFELVYNSSCRSGEVSLKYDVGNFSYRNVVIDMEPNQDYDLGNVYRWKNGFYAYSIKTNALYSDKDTLFYDIAYNNTPTIIDSVTWYFDSTYKKAIGPFTNGMIIDRDTTTVPYIAKPDSYYKGSQIITRWVLKSGNTIHAMERNQKGYIESCKKYSEIVFDISK